MEKLDILTYPDKFLKKTVKPVENINEEIQKLIDNMCFTMHQSEGVGLAATQVGYDGSLLVYDSTPGEKNQDSVKALINPEIIKCEGTFLSENEGCLSVPDFRADVKRYASVIVEGVDREGKPVHIERDDFLGIILQHEIDHLNGVLFIDRISSLKRQLYKRRVAKQLKNQK